jgi:arginine utilization protein RocB
MAEQIGIEMRREPGSATAPPYFLNYEDYKVSYNFQCFTCASEINIETAKQQVKEVYDIAKAMLNKLDEHDAKRK